MFQKLFWLFETISWDFSPVVIVVGNGYDNARKTSFARGALVPDHDR